ncbi:hypothetical protein BV898_19862 [Hypsibius exemplaris]|uniref:Uncharacterized protein n=1 Tax=Hypsibius exemplaris TaxID=2072580 RepID=A0A9X6RQ10_HYPEX|nr:hypothetical protein BV898_19862 [Hypsibius exemplaris]
MGSTAKSPSHLEPTPHNDTLGKRVLETLIAWIGLSAPSQSRGWKGIGRTLRASLLICMALWAMAYEFSTNLNFFFSIRPKDTQIQIVEMVYGTKYMVKTLVTMSVLLLFLWKSSAIRALHDRLHRITNTLTVSTDCARNESLVAWVTIASFSFYMISHGATRIYGVLGIKSLRPVDPIFPGLKVTALQEQCIILTLRNTTEAIRPRCRGTGG